jgi:hypothetical protein
VGREVASNGGLRTINGKKQEQAWACLHQP